MGRLGARAGVGAARGQTVWSVDAAATGANTGRSWTDAFTDVQDALDAAGAGDQVQVAEGVYTPSDTSVRVSFDLPDGGGLFGRFVGHETNLSRRDWRAHQAILSADMGRDDVVGSGPCWYLNWNRHTANSGRFVTAYGVGPTAAVDGFTIDDGATGPDGTPVGDPPMQGSGTCRIGASRTERNNTFLHDPAEFGRGGAVCVLDIFDSLGFQTRFDAGEPYACDCDSTTGPGACDIFDFLCVYNEFAAGCR